MYEEKINIYIYNVPFAFRGIIVKLPRAIPTNTYVSQHHRDRLTHFLPSRSNRRTFSSFSVTRRDRFVAFIKADTAGLKYSRGSHSNSEILRFLRISEEQIVVTFEQHRIDVLASPVSHLFVKVTLAQRTVRGAFDVSQCHVSRAQFTTCDVAVSHSPSACFSVEGKAKWSNAPCEIIMLRNRRDNIDRQHPSGKVQVAAIMAPGESWSRF